MECEMCGMDACSDCHFYRHCESYWTVRNLPEFRVAIQVFTLTPNGKWHMALRSDELLNFAACGRSRRDS